MLPGFFDPHGHASTVGIQAISTNLLPPPDGDGSSIAALKDILRVWMAAKHDFIDRFEIVLGFGYDDS